MTPQRGQTVYYTTSFDTNERIGVIQEVTSVGYLINNTWFGKNEVNIKNVLLDSRTQMDNKQLILG